MPIYEYRCRDGHSFEAFQSMSDDPIDLCRVCDAPAERVLSPVAVHFKGSGFYTTDYARKGAKDSNGSDPKKSGEGGEKKKSESSSSGSDSGSGGGSKSESKAKSSSSD